MTDFPIIMSGPMVRAILDGRKTQTRRLAWRKARPGAKVAEGDRVVILIADDKGFHFKPTIWQKVKPGDRLWLRETWGDLTADHPLARKNGGRRPQKGDRLVYRANPADDAQWVPGHPGAADFTWLPSIHMPRWASRITLLVTDIKRERVQEISDDDAMAEGVEHSNRPGIDVSIDGDAWYGAYRDAFPALWQSLHTKPGARWEDNPEVVALTFKPVLGNIDQIEEAA